MSNQKTPLYITTPIYYVNDVPHLGTAYTTIAADVLAHFGKLSGRPTHFLTGTDEHGEKLETRAKELGETPQAMVDRVSQVFKSAWQELGIEYDDFIRTTEDRHKDVVIALIKKAMEKGDVYLGDYVGWYSISDEAFITESQVADYKDKSKIKKIVEKNYFFKLSKYVPALLEHIQKNPDFILPESKRNEVVSFLKDEVRDISISRTTFSWGIPFPAGADADASLKHIVYVWYDALTNYVSALGYNEKTPTENFNKFWGDAKNPKAIHLIGKDILKFHAVYWPCFLMSVGLPLPKRIFAHGWWTVEGQKMSKSLGNVVSPTEMTQKYGKDAFRLFLFREFPMGSDGDFSLSQFKTRVNADLANNLGNLVSRTLNLISKNMDGVWSSHDSQVTGNVPAGDPFEPIETSLQQAKGNFVDARMESFDYFNILNDIFAFVTSLNKYFDTKAPWTLAKDPTKKAELVTTLSTVAEGIRVASLLLYPFLPTTCNEISKRLGVPTPLEYQLKDLNEKLNMGHLRNIKHTVTLGSPLFPRIID